MLSAELIAVGTEILLGQIDNSHARYLSEELAKLGVSVYYHSAVGDNVDRLTALIKRAMARSQIVILTGGLGPTGDDVTRDAVAEACNLPLTFSAQAYEEHVLPYFLRMNKEPSETNRRQALQIGDAEFLVNPRGTAPGQYVRHEGHHFFLLPGPPLEMRPMFEESVRPKIAVLSGSSVIHSRVLRLYGIGESDVESMLQDMMRGQTNPTLAPLASEGEMVLRLTAKAAVREEAIALIAPVEKELMKRLGQYVYGFDDTSLAQVVFHELQERGKTISFAESCTGGMLSSMIVDLPGSSEVFLGSVVSYSDAVKRAILGVSENSLEQHGAVSEEVARAMAQGVRAALGTDYGVSVTGIAGPGGATVDKPVGLVYTAVASADGVKVMRRVFSGNRMQVRIRAAKLAMYLLLQELIR
ncbi:MAG: competence/damage-inducible protein A [Acidibacillus sp.]|uniref:Putative competence-damage inducible protein n=1 Tax=Sulfoacidibacillus ferrooxidans TaxID=2005001 RepID=A0A9X2ACD3_9BACL|nr:competence/damage-inducible protein A [Sulfoacidibacillus ferrooxidans]MCI0183654.1 putative competence-damage inducible protein [Sulfoacidibacillus ferrooxidans]MCY0892025.1 competence/damage-inducible protein A [Acidibacillus sp.]